MSRYRTTVPSRRATDDAFDYMANFAHSVAWDPGVLEAHRVSGGPIGLGSRFLLVTEFLGRRIPLEYAITHYERPHRLELTAQNASVRSVDVVTFAATDEGTDVTYDATLLPRGPLRLAGPLLSLAFRRIGDRARAGLARELNG